jgi:hypothetical protein
MQWYAVQIVYRQGTGELGRATYEERVLLYKADDVSVAAERAQKDSASYLDQNPGFSLVGEPSIFALNEDVLSLDGAEVWSCLHRGPIRAEEFWSERYEKFSVS